MNALEEIIREIIKAQGAISLAAFMELALQHPQYGYYRIQEPIGRTGDFITAPEVSQMFGECIGIWCVEAWRALGKPDKFALVELGPGRGTMMQDILRATASVDGFQAAKQLYLLDTDAVLREKQSEKLANDKPIYVESISRLPTLPLIIVANEFFDAMPVRQFEKTFRGWVEKMVTIQNDALVMSQRILDDAEFNLINLQEQDAIPGTVIEISPKSQAIVRDLARRIAIQKGAILIIDYGYVVQSGQTTVQAISEHSYADIFERPGEVDLTAHVDFVALSRAAEEMDTKVSKVIGQGAFLKNLGIDIRADLLKFKATLPQAAEIDVALHRLVDPSQMGELFKVLEIATSPVILD